MIRRDVGTKKIYDIQLKVPGKSTSNFIQLVSIPHDISEESAHFSTVTRTSIPPPFLFPDHRTIIAACPIISFIQGVVESFDQTL